MFEKIFGIFRKRKKSDVSQAIPGDTGEDMFDMGDMGFEEEFDADTISLETGMSDGGFSGSSGEESGGLDLGEPVGVTEPPIDEEFGLGMDLGEELAEVEMPTEGEKEPISPPPEVEAYAPPKRRGGIVNALAVAAVAIAALGIGFFGAKPTAEIVRGLLTRGPTPKEQLANLEQANTELEEKLASYRAVGSIEDILAVKQELKKRDEMTKEMNAIEDKLADQPKVEERLDQVDARLSNVKREMQIQKGSLANVQKAVKQLEARNNYLLAATREHIDQIKKAEKKADRIKSRLDSEKIENAEASALLPYKLQEKLEQKSMEALTSS